MGLLSKIKTKSLILKKPNNGDIVVTVPDIKEYLVKEYEKVNELKLINEGLEQQVEKARELELKYNATLVTLDEYAKRLERAEREVTYWKEAYNRARQDVKSANDALNSYKIMFNEVATTKVEISREIVDEVKADIILKINAYKGNLSKKIVCDIIGSYEKEAQV